MRGAGICVAGLVALDVMVGAGIVAGQEPSKELRELAIRLDLSEQGVQNWLKRLGADGGGQAPERLLILDSSGEPIAERSGGESSVALDRSLDGLLREPGMATVAVHNHPRSVGLSAADIGQLAKPGVAAMLAIGHDGSAFLASAGPAMDREYLELRQYVQAADEVMQRLRRRSPDVASAAECDRHFPHLVARALAKAGVIRYWYTLRGPSLISYDRKAARVLFDGIVAGAGARLKKSRQLTAGR